MITVHDNRDTRTFIMFKLDFEQSSWIIQAHVVKHLKSIAYKKCI